MSNSFGNIFRLTSFGESHGSHIGGVIDGCPAGLGISTAFIQAALDKRRPGGGNKGGNGPAGTARCELDVVRVLSGLFEGVTTGAPIAFLIENTDHKSADYAELANTFRPGHADFAVQAKYGLRDYRGGGRFSGRETAVRVAGGAVAELLLKELCPKLCVEACTVELGGIPASASNYADIDFAGAQERMLYAATNECIRPWVEALEAARLEGDSLGGIVRLKVSGMPAGLGEPVFDGLDSRLGAALFSVGAVKGVEIGSGFSGAASRGSKNNDQILLCAHGSDNDGAALLSPCFASNNSGGTLGGISSGQDLLINVAVKPIPTIAKTQHSIDVNGEAISLNGQGRHDCCAIPRIIPALKAMLYLTLADFWLIQHSRACLR